MLAPVKLHEVRFSAQSPAAHLTATFLVGVVVYYDPYITMPRDLLARSLRPLGINVRFVVEFCEKDVKRLNKLKESIAKIANDPNDLKGKRRLTILLDRPSS